MDYSKLVSWRVKNFRNIGDVTLDFTKSPIISLVGENECGKTSIVISFDVLGNNARPKDQKDFIRDNSNGFGIACLMENGTQVIRMKNNSTNLYQVEVPGQPVWQTNKIDGSEVPVEVKNVMGMIMEQETKEPLHVRTYENQLLFVLTKPSENYKVMYDALKVDNLTRAIKDGSSEATALKNTIKSNEISIETLTKNLKSIHIVDIDPALKIKERLADGIEQLEKLEAAMRLIERNKELERQLGSLTQLRSLSEISISELSKLLQYNNIRIKLEKLSRNAERYSELTSLESIDLTAEQKMSSVMGYIDRNSQLEKTKGRYDELMGLEEINLTQLSKMQRCGELMRQTEELERINSKYVGHGLEAVDERELVRLQMMVKIKDLVAANEQKSQEVAQAKEEAHKIEHQIREMGAVVGTCPNCGEAVIMEV